MSDFNPPAFVAPISKVAVNTTKPVELQHNDSKLALSKFGQWYRVGGSFNRDMLPAEVGRVPFPHKLALLSGTDGDLKSGDMLRIQTTQTMPPPNLTMIGVTADQNWSLSRHWGDELLQFYYQESKHSEWKIHLKDGQPGQQIFFGDIVMFEKLDEQPDYAGWMQRTKSKANNEYHTNIVAGATAPKSAEWIIYPDRSN